MKITSLNLQGFEDWNDRLPHIVEYLKQEDPDVVLFQEVVYLPGTSARNQVQLLNKILKYPYEHSAVSRLQEGRQVPVYREGLAVLSRFAVTKTEVLVLEKQPEDHLNRIVQLVDFKTDEQTLGVANVHFSFPEQFAAEHLQETLALLRSRGEKRLIMGDFNLPNIALGAELWQDAYTIAEYSAASFPRKNTKLDYALLPKPAEFLSVALSGDGLSDHRALTIEI